MSIGVIFSIIIVIALIGVSIYVVTIFMGIGECANIGLFKDDFQDAVDRAWRSEIVKDNFVASVPNGIEFVCFSEEGKNTRSDGEIYESLRRYFSRGNMFFYPPENACDQPYMVIEHIEIERFICFESVNGKVTIGLEKDSSDSLVKVRGVK